MLTSVSRVLTANRPVLRWCIRHYEAERQLAEDLLTDLETLNKRGRLPRNRESPLAAPKSTPRHG